MRSPEGFLGFKLRQELRRELFEVDGNEAGLIVMVIGLDEVSGIRGLVRMRLRRVGIWRARKSDFKGT